jgi:hypothetical protein
VIPVLWLALRLMRPYLIAAVALTASSTALVFSGAAIVQEQLDEQGMPDCVNPNWCWPTGTAMNAILGMELVAVFVPVLLGLILGVPLFARERDEGTTAFALTQSVPRGRWVLTKMVCALVATAGCAAVVATTHRLVATRYTVLANDLYELIQVFHSEHIGMMAMQSVLMTAIAGIVGLRGGLLRTLSLSLLCYPIGLAVAFVGGGLLLYPLMLVFPPDTTPAPDLTRSANDDRRWLDDIGMMDVFGHATTPVFLLLVAAIVLLARRTNASAPH